MTEEEVKEVIKEMHNGKAPGPDGFNVDFFKTCWETSRTHKIHEDNACRLKNGTKT